VSGERVTLHQNERLVAGADANNGCVAEAIRELDGLDELRSTGGVGLRVHAPPAQVRTLRDVPPVAGRELPALVRANHDRYFRRVSGEVAVAAEWVVDGEGARVVRAASAPLVLLEECEGALNDRGLRLRDVRPVYDGEELPLELHTSGLARRARVRRLVRWGAVAALALSGWLVAAGAYLVDLALDGATLDRELAALSEPIDRLAGVQEQLERFAPVAAALHRQAPRGESIRQSLLIIASRLPESVHLHELRIDRQGPIRLQAHGGDPIEVVRALSAWWTEPVRVDGGTAAPGAEFGIIMEARR